MTSRIQGEGDPLAHREVAAGASASAMQKEVAAVPEIEKEQERFFAESLIVKTFGGSDQLPHWDATPAWRTATDQLIERFGDRAMPLVIQFLEENGSEYPEGISEYFHAVATESSADRILAGTRSGAIPLQVGLRFLTSLEEPDAKLIRSLALEKIQQFGGQRSEKRPSTADIFRMLQSIAWMSDDAGPDIAVEGWNSIKESRLRVRRQFDTLPHMNLESLKTQILDAIVAAQNVETGTEAITSMRGLSKNTRQFWIQKLKDVSEDPSIGHATKYPEIEYENDRYGSAKPDSVKSEDMPAPPIAISPFESYRKEHGQEVKDVFSAFFESDLPAESFFDEIEHVFDDVANSSEARERAIAYINLFRSVADTMPSVEHVLDEVFAVEKSGPEADMLGELYRAFINRDSAAFELPPSADAFTVYSERRDTTRPISSFVDQYRHKLLPELTPLITEVLTGRRTPEESVNELVDRWEKACTLYREVDKNDVPLYAEVGYQLDRIPKDKKEIFYGRDADYMYWGIKAMRLGLVDAKRPKRINMNRKLVGEMEESRRLRRRVLAYLKQHDVGADDIHIDTGYRGSIPEAVLKLLNPKLNEAEIDKRIKLLESSQKGRQISEGLPLQGSPVGTLERRPKSEEAAVDIRKDRRDRWRTIAGDKMSGISSDAEVNPLKAWVVRQAVTRYFLPRPEGRPERTHTYESETLELAPDIETLLDEARLRKPEDQTKRREKHLAALVRNNLEQADSTNEALTETLMRLYSVSRDIIGPVYADFVRRIETEKTPDGRTPKLTFLGRDGLAPYLVHRILSRRDLLESTSLYLPLSRKLLSSTTEDDMRRYLKEELFDINTIRLVDIGMYGAIPRFIERLFPGSNVESNFLISKSPDPKIHGYLHGPKSKQGSIWDSVSGNPAVHFLEDTYSGFSRTVDHFDKESSSYRLRAESSDEPYEDTELLMRRAALMGIVDAAAGYEPGGDPELNKARLEEYFATEFDDDKDSIMVPHES